MEICRICNEVLIPSFEHIPAKSLNNDSLIFVYTHLSFDKNSEYFNRRKKYPKGMGYYNTCLKCNIFFGSNYVPEFIKFINQFLEKIKNEETKINIKPLNVIKSIYANCLIINYENISDELKSYVVDTNANNKCLNYRVFISQNNTNYFKNMGYHIDINFNNKMNISFIAKIIFPKITIEIVENLDLKYKLGGLEITNFNKYLFNEKTTINIKEINI